MGRARLRTGGVGIVMTHDRYGEQGLNARTFQASLQAMAELGYDYSMLFGISDYYHRFGYQAKAWPERKVYALRRPAGCAAGTSPGRSARRRGHVRPGRGHGHLQSRQRRPSRHGREAHRLARSPLSANLPACHSLTDSQGRIVGYVICQKEGQDLSVLEVGGLGSDCGVRRILAAIREIGKANGCSRVFVSSHSCEHPLVQALRLGSAGWKYGTARAAGRWALR